jgi:hypothetical protein
MNLETILLVLSDRTIRPAASDERPMRRDKEYRIPNNIHSLCSWPSIDNIKCNSSGSGAPPEWGVPISRSAAAFKAAVT